MEDLNKYVTIEELPKYGANYSRMHLWRLRKAGKFPEPLKFGLGKKARMYWREQDLIDWWNGKYAD